MGKVHEAIFSQLLQKVMCGCYPYLVQWSIVQRHGMQPQKKEWFFCRALLSIRTHGLLQPLSPKEISCSCNELCYSLLEYDIEWLTLWLVDMFSNCLICCSLPALCGPISKCQKTPFLVSSRHLLEIEPSAVVSKFGASVPKKKKKKTLSGFVSIFCYYNFIFLGFTKISLFPIFGV